MGMNENPDESMEQCTVQPLMHFVEISPTIISSLFRKWVFLM